MPTAGSPLISFLPLIAIFVIFYVLLILPQQKRMKTHKKMLTELKKGDRVVTNGGILGTIIALRGEIVDLKISEGTIVQLERAAVASLINPETPAVKGNEKHSALPTSKGPIIR